VNDEPITLQNAQGFTQGRPADAELSRYMFLPEYRARRIVTSIDSLTKCLCHFVQQTGLTAPFKSRQ